MHNLSIIFFSAGAAGFLACALAFVHRRASIFDPASAVLAALTLSAWQAMLAWSSVWNLPAALLLAMEILRPAAITLYLQRTLRNATGQGIVPMALGAAIVLGVAVPLVIGVLLPALSPPEAAAAFTLQRAWCGIFIAVGILVAIEQVFRNATGSTFELVRIACAALAVTAIFDLYLFADTLIFEGVDIDAWRARGGVNAFAALLVVLAVARSPAARRISVSRDVAFYTTSLTTAGLFLFAISMTGYAIRRYGGSWGSVLQLVLLFSSLLLVVVCWMSKRIRDRVRVYVAKNFFALRYDYREEWLRLIAELSAKSTREELYVRAIRVLADIYKSPGGLLWLRQGPLHVPVAPCRMRMPEGCSEPAESPFCRMLAGDRVYVEGGRDDAASAAPAWAPEITELGVVIPLLIEDELIGFVALQRSLGFEEPNWEDLDILRTAAREVASYIARYQAAEQLAQARQFDTYHQLTAFIMHDLKNLIAQQELVVKNAAKHKENPAFVEDAIDTIQNSVARMSTLLRKLQQREPSDRRPVELQGVLIDALKKCESLTPKPALRILDRELRVVTDRDHLVMILSHLVKNAQEATPRDGFVDVTLSRAGRNARIVVEDNGSGMSEDFIRTRLFKPFESTKAGKGMGIGAYQAREFIRSLGGDIDVQSAPGAGTTFMLSLPLAGGDDRSTSRADGASPP